MASLGYYILLAAFVACAYAAAISVAGARRRSNALIESGIGAFYLVAALMAAASGVILYAFLAGDYSIKYVQRYSDSALPLFYKVTAYWGGLDGSIMFWVFLLSLFGSVAVYVNRERHRELIPYVVAVIAVVQLFVLLLMVVHNNPFETYLTETHADGRGLNPLLQNPYMVIHPPTMYLGFVGLTIPFAFGMAALISGHLDDAWLRAVRRWTMASWLFLTIGLGLGMIWAYEELGWGGYWFWDPVENAALLPWFTATAFLHSVMVQERRGMLKVWNMTLVILTFFLTIFGTFLTRSGIVQSVHAFGEDPALARMFTAFMIALLVFSFGLVIYRLPLLRARNELDSWVSREAAFMLNNWILLFSAFFVLFATMYPTLSEAVRGERLSVAAPFFPQWMLPIGRVLLARPGVGPVLAWRKTTLLNLRDQFMFPVALGLVVAAAVVAGGVRVWTSGICFALSGMVVGTIFQEFWRGAGVRQLATGTDRFTAMVGLVGRNKRRYGGYIVHLGIVLIFLGFAGEGFDQHEKATMTPGQQVQVRDFVIRYDSVTMHEDAQKEMISAQVTVLRDGREFATMYPAKWFFRTHMDEPTTEVAIRRGFAEDVYIVLAAYDLPTQRVDLDIEINPLANWVWLGFGILALGTGIALLPETVFASALVKVPAGAVTTSMLLLSLVFASGVSAQNAAGAGAREGRIVERGALERQLEGEILCTCGCRRPLNNCGMMNCSGHAVQTEKLQRLIAEGKTHDEIIAIFVRDAGGQDVLSAPIDEGFNRLAWLFPYLIAGGALVFIVVAARRWSRRPTPALAGDAGLDPALDARLDDELRNLD
jgi:cytochrome c-type biogenesis protein CcmF